MQSYLRRILAPPIFPEDEDKTRMAATLNTIAWSTLLVVGSILLIRMVQRNDANLTEVNWALVVVLMIVAFVIYLCKRSHMRVASFLFVISIWAGLFYLAWVADGIRDIAVFAYLVPILMAGLLLGWQDTALLTGLSILAIWALAYAETAELFAPTLDQPMNFARDLTGVLLLIGVLIYLIINNLQNMVNRSRSVASELASSNQELDGFRSSLQQQVEQRTAELKRRAMQLEAVSSVARTIASVQDLDTLLPAITKLVSQQFGFYHVGIFLLDEQRKNAVLRAANSAGGQQMLTRRHSLPLDAYSIVGYATSRGEVRIALDVGADAIYFNNPQLPETRSEMAVPLLVSGRVIGALDVQSTETSAFSQEDVGVLATLADQVAIAIENARLFSETKKALSEARGMVEVYTQQEWKSFAQGVKPKGFLFDGKQLTSLDSHSKREPNKAAIQTGRLSLEKATATIAVPIKLRGQTIGVLDIRAKNGVRHWKEEEIAMLEAAAERAALALENARLLESAQRRAARERAIGDISSRIGSASSLESILQSAVEELGRKIGGATEVTLEINPSAGSSNG